MQRDYGILSGREIRIRPFLKNHTRLRACIASWAS